MSQFEARVVAAAERWAERYGKSFASIFAARVDTDSAVTDLHRAVMELWAQRTYEREQAADVCTCPRDEKVYCAARECHGGDDVPQWVPRTWADVRQGDVIRPPGAGAYRAVVTALGPVNHWHAHPSANQYRPDESPLEWSAIPVTLQPEQGPPYTPEHGMRPDAGVEILMTPAELRAVELLGGWGHRIEVCEKGLSKVDDDSNVD
jgi:hypothetical protein